MKNHERWNWDNTVKHTLLNRRHLDFLNLSWQSISSIARICERELKDHQELLVEATVFSSDRVPLVKLFFRSRISHLGFKSRLWVRARVRVSLVIGRTTLRFELAAGDHLTFLQSTHRCCFTVITTTPSFSFIFLVFRYISLFLFSFLSYCVFEDTLSLVTVALMLPPFLLLTSTCQRD